MFETTRPNQNSRKSRNSRAASVEVRPGSAALASSSPPSVSRAGASCSFDVIVLYQCARAARTTLVLLSHHALAPDEHRARSALQRANVLVRQFVPDSDVRQHRGCE